jgi:hypothetical protein
LLVPDLNHVKNPYGLGTGMFGTDHEDLIKGLQRIGNRICQYGPLGDWPRRCDCKYGVETQNIALEHERPDLVGKLR